VAHKGEKRMNMGFWLGDMNEIANLEDLGIGAKTIFKQILNRLGGHRPDYSGSELGHTVRSCDHHNGPSRSVKLKEFD
jgi:hypothetical protein